jgi:simple sugar transport system ATP-binding protein
MTHANDLPLISMRDISKHFGGVTALAEVNFDIHPGEVVGLVGDNGAGKSTLMKILSGVYQADEGEILFQGRPVELEDPTSAKRLGIEMVYQDLALCDNLNIAENMFLGRELKKRYLGGLIRTVDTSKMSREAREVLERLKVHVPNARAKVMNLSGGQRKAVAIGRALLRQAKLLIMDEPTAALAVKEIEKVLSLVDQLRRTGVAVIFISHNLQEVFATVDRIVVLRAGELAGIRKAEEVTTEEVVSLMVGG